MAKKSKEIISTSFLSILKDNPFEVITISEICDHTPLVRKTFYNNFASKEDIVSYICRDLVEQYISLIIQSETFSMQTFARTFFEFGKHKCNIFKLLITNNLFYIFQLEFNAKLSDINALIPQNKLLQRDEKDLHYIFSFHSAGVLCLFEMWIKSDFEKTIDEISEIYTSTVKDVQ